MNKNSYFLLKSNLSCFSYMLRAFVPCLRNFLSSYVQKYIKKYVNLIFSLQQYRWYHGEWKAWSSTGCFGSERPAFFWARRESFGQHPLAGPHPRPWCSGGVSGWCLPKGQVLPSWLYATILIFPGKIELLQIRKWDFYVQKSKVISWIILDV